MYTITIRAAPMASGANAPAGPESAITDRKMNVPTNSVSNFAASLMIDPNVARDAAPRGGFPTPQRMSWSLSSPAKRTAGYLTLVAIMSFAWSGRRTLLALVASGVLGLGIASGVLTSRLASPRSHAVARAAIPSATPVNEVQPPAVATPDHWWKPLPAATAAFQPALLVIEKLRVLAPVEVKGVDYRNAMEAPDRPTDAAWYRFTARP